MKLPDPVKKLAMTGVTFALFLLLLELAVRLLSLGKTFVPGVSARRYIGEAGREIDFLFNREGFRDRDYPQAKPPGVRRIAVLGDSMIAAMAVDEGETLVRLLEQKLDRSHPGTDWEVMNFAISGAGPGQSLVVYREVAARYDADLVLFCLFVGNDLGDSSRELTSSKHRIYFKLDEAGELVQLPHSRTRSSLSRWLNRHSRLYVWQKHQAKLLKMNVEGAMDVMVTGHVIFDSEPEAEVARAWAILEALIRAMQREVEAAGGRFALVVLPTAEQMIDERWQALLEQSGSRRMQMDADYPERRLRAIAADSGLPILTLVEPFRQAMPHRSLAHEEEWLHFQAKGHFNEAGHRIAAAELHRFVVESGLLAEAGELE
jgi:hypothetical protein